MFSRPGSFLTIPSQRWMLAWSLALGTHLGALLTIGLRPGFQSAPEAGPLHASLIIVPVKQSRPAVEAPQPEVKRAEPRPSPLSAHRKPAKPKLVASTPDADHATKPAPVPTPEQGRISSPRGVTEITNAATSAREPAPPTAHPLPQQRCPQQVVPDFPSRALRAGILEGRVELRLYLDGKGTVTTTEVLLADPPGYFEEAAHEAAQHWHCLPANEAGASVIVPFVFKAQ